MKGSTGSNAAPPLARAQPRGLPSGRDPMRGMGIGGARLRRAAAGVLALLLAVPALAADWYAAPGGSGSLCSQASPCTIQGAIDAAAPYDTVHVAAGDYAFTSNRIVIETEGLRLVGDNSPFAKPYATPPGPGQIAHGTADNKAANASVLKAASAAAAGGGTSAMVWVRNVPNVRIEKLYIEVNSSAPFLGSPRAKEGIAATGNVNGLELVDNYIKITSGTAAIGLGLNLSAGSNSSVPAAEPRGNGDFVTVDGNVVEPTSSASAAPKYAIGLQNSTGVFVRNQVAGHTMDMSLKPVAKGANPLAQRVFKVEENWTFGRLGLYIAGGYSLAEPARIANNHFVMSQEYGDDADTHLVSLKGISAPGTIVEGNVFTGFRKNYSGLWVQSRPNVTIQGNTFQPLAGQSDFRAIVVGNWSLQTGVPPSPATFDVTIRGNTFLANGATSINKGKAILFVDDNDASGAATFTKAVVGGSQLADANSFDSGIGWYIALDDRTCTGRNHASTSGGCNGGAGYAIGQGINYTSGTDGSSISQKRPFKWDVQAAGNSFGGVYMPSMGLAQFNAVWAKTYDKHNAGDTTVGNVLYGYPPITSGTITFTPTAFAYDGNAHPISATLAEDPDATCIVTPATITNAGTHAVAADCVSSTYHVTGSDSVVVSKAAGSVVWGTLNFTYDGSSPTVTATLAEETGVACTVTGAVGPNAGSYPVSASCNGSNHTASGNATATIAKATGAVAWGTLNFTYDGSSPTVTATLAEETGVACTVTGTVGPNAGSYPVIASCDGSNHAASGNATATIAKATGTVSFGPTNFTFDGTAHSTTVELAQEPAVTCALTPTGDYPRLHAGSTTLAATCAGTNYEASGSTTLVVAAKGVSLALTGLGTFPYDGNPHPAGVTVTGEVTGFPAVVDITYDGGATPPVGVGSHAVAAELAASATDYSASPVSGLIVIEVAQATVTLGDLSAVYDGDPHAASVSTEPTGLTVSVTYDGVNDVPVNAGSYAVVATVTQQGYSGSASGTLVIAKAEATVAITDTTQAWDGNPKPVTVTTTPANLAVAVTYDGDGTPPSAVGSYAVVATITDANHSGSANATLTITAGAASGIAANGATTFTGVAGQPLTGALPAVKVTDAGGHPVAGVAVTFTAGANSGTLTGASQTTDSSGIATLGGWILDATPGTNTVVASAAGVTGTVAFTATGVSVLDGFNVSISDGRNATQVGRLLTYTITVGNAGSFGANGVHVTDMLPDELDVAGAQWQCSASNGASCTASGSGDLDDTIDLPAGGSVVYLLTAQVVADIDGMIDNGVTVAAGGNSIVRTDSTEIVIFRDGFELGGDGSDWDEAIEPVAAGSLSETQELTLDVAGLAPLQRVTVAQAADRTFAVEAIRIGETVLVRLVAGRQATAWSALDGERFALVLVGTRLGLVGAQADLVVELAQGGSLAVERLMHH